MDREDLTRHDKWLCMMTPRLKLLKELLREDGVIFISIDDNEVHRLRMLMDEIFQDNFVGQFVWRKRAGGGSDNKYLAVEYEYVLCYLKNHEKLESFRIPYTKKRKGLVLRIIRVSPFTPFQSLDSQLIP